MSRKNGDILFGQEYLPQDNLVVPFTEQMQNHEQGVAADAIGDTKTEVIPIDANASRVRVYTPSAAQIAVIEATYLAFAATANLVLPDTLTALAVVYNEDNKDGSYVHDGDGVSAGASASLTLNLHSRAESSASVVPDLQPTIVSRWGRNVPVTQYFFYMAGNVTQAAAITRVNALASITVNAWPLWRPTSHIFTLKGQAVSVSADAAAQQHVSFSDSNVTLTYGLGEGTSRGFNNTVRTMILPPTIHGAISLTGGNTSSKTATAAAESDIGEGNDALNWPARNADTGNVTAVATGGVLPTSVSATTGDTSIPASGLYLHEMRVSPWRDGYNAVFMEVVNFANVG